MKALYTGSIGSRYGKLVVTSVEGYDGKARLVCARCDCGSSVTVRFESLRSGNTKSCGCRRLRGDLRRTHGHSKHLPEYFIWKGMRQRCSNPRNQKFKDYGARGISVCERWDSFEAFLSDMGRRPSPGHSIDRKNNDGNYEPGNCRWATAKEQAANTRRSRKEKSCPKEA